MRWRKKARAALALAASGLGALALGGCASSTLSLVDQRGSAPAAGRYALAADPEAPAPAGLAAAMGRQLGRQSLTPADDHPQFRVEAVYSERQGPVGAFSALGADGRPQWLASPPVIHWWSWNRRPQVRQLTVRILEAGSGAEVYRATAVQQGGKAGPVDWDKLAAAAVAPAAPAKTSP